jgi:hypothetical protein
MPHVRVFLVETNVLHRLPHLVSRAKGTSPTVAWAVALLYYYFSVDLESENVVYNQAKDMLANNGSPRTTLDLRVLTLYTLHNLIGKCIDSKPIADLFMAIIRAFTCLREMPSDDDNSDSDSDGPEDPPYDRNMAMMYLPLLLGMCEFSNLHFTLVGHDLLEMLCEAVDFAVETKDVEIAQYVAKILISFFTARQSEQSDHHQQSPAAVHVVNDVNFSYLVEKLLEIRNNNVLRYVIRSLAVLSGFSSMLAAVSDGAILGVVSNMIEDRDLVPTDIALDVAKYFCNVCKPLSEEHLRGLVEEESVHTAVLQLLDKSEGNADIQTFASRTLLNILSSAHNCSLLAEEVLEPIMKIVRVQHDIAAVNCLFNLAVSGPKSLDLLVKKRVHVSLQSLLPETHDVDVKERYLLVLLQLSSRPVCVNDFVKQQLVTALHDELTRDQTPEARALGKPLWANATALVLQLVNKKDAELSQNDRATVVAILKVVCQKNSPHAIIAKAAVVLALLSINMESFIEVDAVLRSILSISSDETVLEAASIVLYNVSCSDRNASILLQDGVYINIMLRIMRARNCKPEVQLNIAQALRTLCSLPRCVELMLAPPAQWVPPGGSLGRTVVSSGSKDTPLADLIVIALLVATGENIKLVCSEAFYNMLGHRETRTRLVRGDLFWAVTKLSKEGDVEEVRLAGMRAIFDLSCDLGYIESMRDSRVLTFLQEVGCNKQASQPFVDTCVKAFVNIVRQFSELPLSRGLNKQLPSRLASFEILACLRLCTEVLRRSSPLPSVRHALTLLLLCARQEPEAAVPGGANPALSTLSTLSRGLPPDSPDPGNYSRAINSDTDFVQQLRGLTSGDEGRDGEVQVCRGQDLAAALLGARGVWAQCPRSRLIVSRLLWLMSKSSYLARKVSLSTDLQTILSDCYLGDRQGKAKGGPDESSSPELLAEMCENCLGTIVHYWLHERVNAAELVGMPIFHVLIADTFAARRPGAVVLSNTKGAYRLEARALGLSLLASTVGELISIDQGRLLSRELLSRVVTADHFSAAATRDNLQVVILAASTSAVHAGHMYDEGLIRVVLSDLETFTFPNEGMNQYCSSLIRNLALHEELIPGLLERDMGLSQLILLLLDVTRMEAVCVDLCVFLYSSVRYRLRNDAPISSTFCLQLTTRLVQISQAPLVVRATKYVVGEILEKFSEGVGVNPAFVQAMYTELQQGSTAFVAVEMDEQESVQSLPGVGVQFALVYLRAVSVPDVPLEVLEDDPNCWNPYLAREIKRMAATADADETGEGGNTPGGSPMTINELTASETIHVAKWEKVDKVHKPVGLPRDAGLTLIDEDVEDDTIDEEDEGEGQEEEESVLGKDGEGEGDEEGEEGEGQGPELATT